MQILQSRRFAGWRGANPHKGATEPRPYAVCVDFSFAFTPDLIAVFVTLFVLEIVLGVDNVIFISILASKLPKEQQARARNLGLTLAMLIRVGLVFAAGWIITLTEPVVTLWGISFSWKDFILIAGGLFLVYTRRGANNDHIPRNRAPLFIARVDPGKLHVIRATERIAIPERGADIAGKVERPGTFLRSARVNGSPMPSVPQSRS